MKLHLIWPHLALSTHAREIWEFGALVLLILFITLVVNEGSKDKEK
jgi:hypothetical protein